MLISQFFTDERHFIRDKKKKKKEKKRKKQFDKSPESH